MVAGTLAVACSLASPVAGLFLALAALAYELVERTRSGAVLAALAVAAPVLVPDDAASCDAAVLSARTLVEQAATSPARTALAALATRLDLECRAERVATAATAGAH